MKKDYRQAAVIVGQTTNPDRRRVGLEFIRKAVALEPEPELRSQLRDEAVKFLVLRDVETRPEPAVTRASGLIFGRDGHRLGILSEDNEELTFWNVDHNQRLATFSLRAGSGNLPGAGELNTPELLNGDRGELAIPSGSDAAAGGAGATASTGAGPVVGVPRRFRYSRIALAGHYVAALSADDSGVRLIDPLSGVPFRSLPRRGSSVVGVLGDPAGRRLLTIETVSDDPLSAELEGLPDWDTDEFRGRYLVNLWDPDHLDAPIRELNRDLNWRDQRLDRRRGLTPPWPRFGPPFIVAIRAPVGRAAGRDQSGW